MSDSTHLGLPYLAAAQAQKHVTHNEALTLLDGLVQLAVKSRAIAIPPATPLDGDRYLVAASPTGMWVGQAGKIALCMAGAWKFLSPREGFSLWVDDENVQLAFDGATWNSAGAPSSLQNLSLLGVNATADATNKLSVASAASLFSHVGNGHQIKLNKNAAADTASLMFQTGFSGRAEFGTTGDDDFRVKVSADGTTFHDAIVIARASGLVTARKTLRLEPQAGDPATPADGQFWYDQTSGKFRVRQNGASLDMITAGGGLSNGYALITDGTTTASAGGSDTFKVRTAAGLSAVVASNDPTHGDNILIQPNVPGLAVVTAPATNDDFLIYDTSAASHGRMSLANALKVVASLAEDVTPDYLSDEFLCHDSSTAEARRVSGRNSHFAQLKARARYGFEYLNDFIQDTSATAGDGLLVETNAGTSAATSALATTASNFVGMVQSTTGSTATGRAALSTSLSPVRLGGGEWFFEALVALPVLSNATERFQVEIGFIDTVTALNPVDGVYFLYDEGGASIGSAVSGNWQCVTSSNGTRSFVTTSTAVSTAAVRLGIEINAAGTSAQFFINGTSVATITTNIPVGAARETGFGGLIIKSIGLTARTLNYDYISAACKFTAPR